MFRAGPKYQMVQQRTDQVMQQVLWFFLVFAIMWAWSGSAYAQLSGGGFDESNGPFAAILCPAVRWIINLLIPLAMCCFIAVGAEMLWGDEIKGILKKMLVGVIGLTAALSMIGIVSWIAGKFGFGNACTGVVAGF